MAKVTTQLVDPLGRNIGGVPNPTITNVVNTTPISTASPTQTTATPTSTTPTVSPTLQAIRAAKAKTTPAPTAPVAQETTGPQTGNTINMTAEQYAAGVAKVGKEKMDASMQKYLNQGGTITGQQASITGDKVSSVNEPIAPVAPTTTTTTEKPTEPTPTEHKPTEAKPTEPVAPEAPKPVVPISAQNLDEAFATLMSGGTLADTRENYGFKAVYGQFNAINSLDDKTLGTKMAQGTITPQMSNLLARYNPAKFAAAQKIANETTAVNDINTNAERLHATTTGTTPKPVVKTSEEMMQDLLNGIEKVGEKYSDIVAKAYADNPQIKEKADKIAVLDDKIENIDIEIDKIAETYRTQYPDVPQAMLMGMVNRAAYGLTQERNALVRENKLLYAQYKDEKDMIDKGIEYDIAQEEKMNERLFDLKKTLYGDKRADEIRDEDYARAEERIKNDRTYTEEQRKIALKDNLKIALSDLGEKFNPTADYNTLLGQYADAKKREMANEIEKGRYLNLGGGKVFDTKTQTTIGASELSRTSPTFTPVVNKDGTISINPNSKYTITPVSDTAIQVNAIPGTKGGQCGTFVNDFLGGGSRLFMNKYEEKQRMANSSEPKAGSVFIEKNLLPYGHVGIIESVDENGNLTVIDSNYSNNPKDETIRRRTIPKGSEEYNRITGYYDPTQTKPTDTDTTQFSSAEIALFNGSKYNPQTDKNEERVQRYNEYQNAKATLESSDNPDMIELMRTSEGGKAISESGNKAYKDMGLVVNQLAGLKGAIKKYNDDKLFGDYLSPITGLLASNNPWDSKAADVKARLQAVVPKVARGIFGEVGVLTDQDVANYMQTLPNLKQTADVQDVVQLALLGTLKNALDSAILVDSGTYNVSGIIPAYKKISDKIAELEGKVSEVTTEGGKYDEFRSGMPSTGTKYQSVVDKYLKK